MMMDRSLIQVAILVVGKQLGEDQRGVQRGPELMAHVGEEFALVLVRPFEVGAVPPLGPLLDAVEILDGRLSGTVAFFGVKREDISSRDSAREVSSGRQPFFIYGDAEESQGIEVSPRGRVPADLIAKFQEANA